MSLWPGAAPLRSTQESSPTLHWPSIQEASQYPWLSFQTFKIPSLSLSLMIVLKMIAAEATHPAGCVMLAAIVVATEAALSCNPNCAFGFENAHVGLSQLT